MYRISNESCKSARKYWILKTSCLEFPFFHAIFLRQVVRWMLLTTNVKTITISYTIKSIVGFIIFEKLFPLFVTRVFLPFSFPMAMNLFHLWTIERNVHLCTFYYRLYHLHECSAYQHVFLCPRLNSNYFDCIK